MAAAAEPKRRKLAVPLGVQFQCPCCFRRGTRFCDSFPGSDPASRLQALRALLVAHAVDAYLVGSEDAHSSEYVAAADERRAFLTGFTGSAGTALVTATAALVWTDSRYFLQAEEQLKGTEWALMRLHQPGVLDVPDWVLQHLKGKRVAVDPALLPAEKAQEWRGKWGNEVALVEIAQNLVDAVWTNRPEDPCGPIEVHPLEFAGEGVEAKLRRLRGALGELGAQATLISALDQIAWLFNLRGSDIECNPVFFAYAAISEDSAVLFVRPVGEGKAGLGDAAAAHLRAAGVAVRPYGAFFAEAPAVVAGRRTLLDLPTCSLAVLALVPQELRVVGASPAEDLKAAKNQAEIEGLRRASQRDSAALCEFFASLEERLAGGGAAGEITEVGAAEMLSKLRLQQELCVGDSFPTISAVGSNASIVHYRPEADTCKALDAAQVYLCDTGGQYRDGTTDVTRTVHFGTPTAEERRCFTRVLQAHIALASAVFPEGTPGLMLDAIARQPLWRDGLNYGHGTSHGMGAYLNVHEGPMGIGGGSVSSSVIRKSERMKRVYLEPFRAGMFVSDEPGYYKDGEFGIRIESDLVVVPARTEFNTGTRPWLRFECLTLVPMCRALIEPDLLSAQEAAWLDAYHRRVWESLEGALAGALEGRAREWLRRATQPLRPQA